MDAQQFSNTCKAAYEAGYMAEPFETPDDASAAQAASIRFSYNAGVLAFDRLLADARPAQKIGGV